MRHIHMRAKTMGRFLAALAALSCPMATPSMGATSDGNLDIPAAPSSGDQTPSVSQDASARTVTRIDVHRGADDVSVAILGDGKLLYEATRVGSIVW